MSPKALTGCLAALALFAGYVIFQSLLWFTVKRERIERL